MKKNIPVNEEMVRIRGIAEEKLKGMPTDIENISVEDAKILLHELQVHQIELELQNEELRQAQLALDESREKYFDLYNLAPIGYVSINEKGFIIEANLTSSNLLGIDRRNLINTPFSRYILKEDQDIYYKNNKRLLATGIKQHFEIRLIKNKNKEFWTDVEIVQTKSTIGEFISLLAFNDLTVNKEFLRNSLLESEKRFQLALKHAPVTIASENLEGRYTYAYNHKTIPSIEVIGKSDSDIFAPEDLPRIKAIKNEVLQTGKPLTEELWLTSNGKRVFVDVYLEPSFNEEGKITGLDIATVDNTVRKLVEEQLVESRQQWMDTFNHIPDLLAIIDNEHRIARANNAMLDKLGCTIEEARGKYCFECVHGEDSPPESCPHSMLLNDGKEHTVEIFEKKLGGYFLVSCTPIFNKKGNLNGSIHVARDISERKSKEKELKETYDKLQIALENADIGIWEWNLKTNELYLDKRAEKMFGFRKGAFNKTYSDFEKLLNEEDIPHIEKALQTAIKENKPFESIYRIKTNKGDLRYINSKGLVYIDKGKNPIKMSGVCVDITEMKKGSEQALFKLNEELLRSNKELAQFAYVASHDLQEPLRIVSLYTQLLAKRYGEKLEKDGKDFINFAVEGAGRMHTLIEDLLKYSRVNTQGESINEVDMLKVVEKVKNNLSSTIKELNVKLKVDYMPVVKANEYQMTQLIQNLVSNAIKFCKNKPEIHIKGIEKGDDWQISVKDNGIGIKEEYKDRIFQIFQRLHTKEEYPGTGIGLAICKRIIERHGGKIWIEQEKKGNGTIFKFTIPKNKSNFI